ncbi:MAG: response regulator transcription factor [Planctomycetota bacterium]
MNKESIRILIVDDHSLFRSGIACLLQQQADFSVVAEAKDIDSALASVDRYHPEVVVLSINSHEINGAEITRQIKVHHPAMSIVVLSYQTGHLAVGQILKSGVSGYLTKNTTCEELVRAIKTVAGGKTYLSTAVAGVVVARFVRGESDDSPTHPYHTLTNREREVLKLLAKGESKKSIAEQLAVSVKTIHTHQGRMMRKLGLKNLAEITRFAICEGIISLEPADRASTFS